MQERETREREEEEDEEEEEEEEELIIARKERVKEENKVCSMVEASEHIFSLHPQAFFFRTGYRICSYPTYQLRSCCCAYDLRYVFCSLWRLVLYCGWSYIRVLIRGQD